VLDSVLGDRVIAIVRAENPRWLPDVVSTLLRAGVRTIEFPLTTPRALGILETLSSRHGTDAVLGVGTVLDAQAAEESVAAGAAFLVSPALSIEVLEVGRRNGVPVLPGAFTPTELTTCWQHGAPAVKLFPASLGGPAYIRAVRAPLPHIPIVPTGGVSLDQVAAYLEEGAAAVGIGSPLIGDAAAGGSLAALFDRASELMSIVREAVPPGERRAPIQSGTPS